MDLLWVGGDGWVYLEGMLVWDATGAVRDS